MMRRKLVLEEHDGSVLVGVFVEGCDPKTTSKNGSLEDVLPAVPDFLKKVQEEWGVSPKNPAYTPPVAAKPAITPAAATTPAQKAEDLPLLAGTEKAKPAEAPAPTEAQAEVEVKPEEFPAEIQREAEAVATEVAKESAPSAAVKPGEWDYYLQDGRGPFESVQAAMDELGLDKATRPMHNRWDRLSTALKEKIQRRPKA